MFDEDLYLKANPDVAAAVRTGAFSSGLEHYEAFGRNERRAVRPGCRPAPLAWPFPQTAQPTRRDKMLAGLDLKVSRGVEIGALMSPVVSPEEGDIVFVDHASTEDLKKKYAADPSVNTDEIVDVTGVWGEKSLFDCVGDGFDFVAASHVVEHVPDLVTWLHEIRAVLKPGGSLRLAIPDRRYCFDYYRHETRLHDVLDAYLQKARRPMPKLILEHFSMNRPIDAGAIWSGEDPGPFESSKPAIKTAIAIARDALNSNNYHDVHCWTFTPASFRDLMCNLDNVDLLPFHITNLIDTEVNELEFFAHLTAK